MKEPLAYYSDLTTQALGLMDTPAGTRLLCVQLLQRADWDDLQRAVTITAHQLDQVRSHVDDHAVGFRSSAEA